MRFFRWRARVILYLVVIAALLVIRGGLDLNRVKERLGMPEPALKTLSIAGADLAPELTARLVAAYRRDYPQTRVEITGGGTARALEALVNRRAEVAFLSRPPTAAEQDIFRNADGDTARWVPVALGAILVLAGPRSPVDSVSVAELRRLAGGTPVPPVDRLYVPDPNRGLWAAFRERLGLAPGDTARPADVAWLADDRAVAEAVRRDPGALGVAGALALTPSLDSLQVRAVPVRADSARAASLPGDEAVAYGRYPLYHRLYAAVRTDGGLAGRMFVTYLTSPRGQRRMEREGYLPSERTLREVVLTREPIGGSK